MKSPFALETTQGQIVADEMQIALRHAVRLWTAAVTSSASEQHDQLIRYKQRVVTSFFNSTALSPSDVTANDVERWRDDLIAQGLQPATVYARVSFLSSFFSMGATRPGSAQVHHQQSGDDTHLRPTHRRQTRQTQRGDHRSLE